MYVKPLRRSAPAPLVGEPLAKPETLRLYIVVCCCSPLSSNVISLPRAPLLGGLSPQVTGGLSRKLLPLLNLSAFAVTERLYKAELNRYQKSSPFRGSWENYMGVKPFSTAASHPCPAHRGRCARQWCSRSATGPLRTVRRGTLHAGPRGSASTGACLPLRRSRSLR